MRSTNLQNGIKSALPLLSEVCVVAVAQMIPIVAMSVTDYARYTSIYLIFGVMYGIVLATICDVWARSARRRDELRKLKETQGDATSETETRQASGRYSGALLQAAMALGATNGILALFVVSPASAALAGVATTLGIIRSGNRYFLLARGKPAKAGLGDLAGALVGATIWLLVLSSESGGVNAGLVAWLATSLTSVLLCSGISIRDTEGLLPWVRSHWTEMRALLGDSLLMNISSVVTPYLAAFFGGFSAMALVRSSTSLLYPVRLVLGVLRPRLVSQGTENWIRSTLNIAGFGAVTGIGVAIGLFSAKHFSLFPKSTFALLADYHIAIGFLTLCTAVSVFLQFEARGRLTASALIGRRLTHTAILVIVVSAATLLGGYSWASAGLAIASALSIPLWAARKTGQKTEDGTAKA